MPGSGDSLRWRHGQTHLGLSHNMLQLMHFCCIRPRRSALRSSRADGVMPVAPRCGPHVYPRLIAQPTAVATLAGLTWVLRCFSVGGTASPTAHSYHHSHTVASPEPPRSTSVWATEVLRGGSGEACGRVRCKVGGSGSQRLGWFGGLVGSGWRWFKTL